MEKTVSVEERIKRAEEIYQRRKMQDIRMPSNTVNIGNSPNFSLFKKTFIKIFFCIVLYFLLFFIKNSNYFFSNELISKMNEILSYDINLQGIYNDASKYLGDLFYNFQNQNDENQLESQGENNEVTENKDINENENNSSDENNNNQNEAVQEDNQVVEISAESAQKSKDTLENQQSQSEELHKQNQENLGVGGTDETINNNEEQVNQMDIDAKYIKENFKIELPLKGTITSRFGFRTPTNIISANHAGIDIGASEGTKIKAAMDGKITLVSSEGDYRKSYRNTK